MRIPPQPIWTRIDGQHVLQVPHSRTAAVPLGGGIEVNARRFLVFDMIDRTEICQLTSREVRPWLIKKALDECGVTLAEFQAA